jgi:hypothetical protein
VVHTILQHPELELHDWVKERVCKDKDFINKLFIISSFQRSGRQSEVSSSENPALYESYQEGDRSNFIGSVDHMYFCCDREILEWSVALRWDSTRTEYVENVSKILKVAHFLDLRRIPRFDQQRIRKEIGDILGICRWSGLIDVLWNQSGIYLQITGDRDMCDGDSGRDWKDRFFTLQQNPTLLYTLLAQRTI